MTNVTNMDRFKAALADATGQHSAPNSFGAAELHEEYGAPPVQWQRSWYSVAFSVDGAPFEARKAKTRTGRIVWAVDRQRAPVGLGGE